MHLFEGQQFEDERYSCKCGQYSGHTNWKCNNCGCPIIISGKMYGGKKVSCYRISPDELEEGMYLLLYDGFYKILHIFDPIDEDRMYVNLKEYGSYEVNRHRYVLVMYQ